MASSRAVTPKVATKARFDVLWRSILVTQFFREGWGKPDHMRRMLEFRSTFASRSKFLQIYRPEPTAVRVTSDKSGKEYDTIEGEFQSPFARLFPAMMVPPNDVAKFQLIQPKHIERRGAHRPVVVQLPSTGDHGFETRRRFMAADLARRHGISSIILENPFYGSRKPLKQKRSSLMHVTDLFVMGGALMMECSELLHWARSRQFQPLALSGVSLGGHMASLATTVWPEPISLIPCLSWSTASQVFTEGVISGAIPWDILAKQFEKYKLATEFAVKKIGVPRPTDADGSAPSVKPVRELPPNELAAYEEGAELAKVMKNQNDVNQDADRFFTRALGNIRAWIGVDPISTPTAADRLPNKPEVVEFMAGIMDEFTHMVNFDRPVDPSLVVSVQAVNDAYVPRDNVSDLREIWGDEVDVRYMDTGHVGAFLRYRQFQKAIVDSLDKQTRKYGTGESR